MMGAYVSAVAHPEVLLVEDSEHDAELTLKVLSEHELAGRVVWVREGAEALDYIFGGSVNPPASLAAQPRVVLLDIKTAHAEGYEVLQRIRADPRTRHIPVVVLSSSDADQDITRALEAGASSYVVKPVGHDAFAETVRQIGIYWLRVHQSPEDL